MDRRHFLVGTGAALGAGLATAALARDGAGALPIGAASDWPGIRAQFALDPALIHMSGFFLASHPRAVREAIERHRRGLDSDPYHYLEDNVRTFETGLRASAARHMGVDSDLLAFTDSTTMGIGLVYTGFKLKPGQEIVTDTRDHIVTTIATQTGADRSGATVRRVPLYADPAAADADAIAESVARALTSRTRLLALTWVHWGPA